MHETLILYKLLIYNSFLANILGNPTGEFALPAMIIFNYDKSLIYSLAFIAYVAAGVFNYLLGKILYDHIIKRFNNTHVEEKRSKLITNLNKKTGILLVLLLSFIPLFNQLSPVLLGFANYGYKRLLIFVSIVRLVQMLLGIF